MRILALLVLVVSGCATTGARSSGPREIAGWPEWLCLEFASSQNMSFWYLKNQTAQEGRAFEGSCDSWARTAPKVKAHPPPVEGGRPPFPPPKPIDPKLLKPFHAVSNWPGWVCADFKDGRPESVWRRTSKVGPPETAYPGRCEDWEEQSGIVRPGARAPKFKISGGKGRATLLFDPPLGTAEVALTLLELDPGASVAEHEHEHSAEYLYLEQGQVEMTIDGKIKSAGGGDAIHIPAGIKHSTKIVGDVMVKAVQIYTPPGPEQRFRKGEKIR